LQDSKDSIYIYEQTNESHCFTGFIAGSSIEEYLNGKIKIHEQTISSREEMFSKYLNETGFNAEPVLLTYNNKSEIDTILETNKKSRPEYEFATTNKTIHKLWVIDKEKEILQIQKEFSNVGSLYIADGHHRMASSSLLYKKQKTKNNSFCLSFFIAKNQLNIINFNRLVKDLNKLNSTSFIEELKKKFIVTKEDYLFEPKAKNEIGMYFENNWYSLKNNFPEESNIVDNLDPSILTNKILSPILNIHDLRNDKRVDFISGDNLRKAKELVDKKDFKVLFVLKKESVNKLMQVADLGLSMPPKSTYILPKLRSGLIIYKLK
jgi:uncharacterized protein (DUF1015 family)